MAADTFSTFILWHAFQLYGPKMVTLHKLGKPSIVYTVNNYRHPIGMV